MSRATVEDLLQLGGALLLAALGLVLGEVWRG